MTARPVRMHTHGSAPLEAKVTVPAISTAILVALVAAVYGVAKAFGLELSSEQEKALAGLGLAVLPLLQFVIGYYAPHTPRPDVPHDEPHDSTATGQEPLAVQQAEPVVLHRQPVMSATNPVQKEPSA